MSLTNDNNNFLVFFSVVSGGAALVAASSVTGLSLAPAWGGLLFGKTFKGLSGFDKD